MNKKTRRKLYENFANWYAKVFSKGRLSYVNGILLDFALRARGYNNSASPIMSGEDWFVKNILKSNEIKLVVDVGANTGAYSNAILEQTAAQVIAFEPLEIPFTRLLELSKRYPGRLTCIRQGVGLEEGEQEINFDSGATQHASFLNEVEEIPYVKNKSSEKVFVTTLDTYFANNPVEAIDLLKIDTEGFETKVLDGAADCIEKLMPKYIQIEFNWHQLFVRETLLSISQRIENYDIYRLLPNGWIKADPKDPMSNIYHFANFVFIRKDVSEKLELTNER